MLQPRDRVESRSSDRSQLPWTLYSKKQRWVFLSMLFLVTTWNYFDYNIMAVALDPIKREFGVSDTMLGLLSGVGFALLYAIASLPIARWADRGNRRTVIVYTLAAWSAMTALCGMVQTFWQLAVARLGVAMTEPGAAPPSQSLVVDYFPPDQRATAIALLSMGGSSAGYCIGVGFGGYIAATHGWRLAFLLAGLPGVLLAVITRFTLAEPRSEVGFPVAEGGNESTWDNLRHLQRKRTYTFILVGLTVFSVFAYGVSIFLPSYMTRALHATLEQVSLDWGFAVAAGLLAGAVIGGRVADRLSARDVRWYVWLPSIAYTLGAPLYWWALSAQQLWQFILLDSLAEMLLSIGTAVAFAAVQPVCGSQRRAAAVAIVYFSMMLVGCGVGPLISGVISDALAATYGAESLRPALMIVVTCLIPAALAFYIAGRFMLHDLES